MAYIAKKKIKGIVYLYAQRSYRENGKVKTAGTYIGPAGGCSQVAILAALDKQEKAAAIIKKANRGGEVQVDSPAPEDQEKRPKTQKIKLSHGRRPSWVEADSLKGARLQRLYGEIGFDPKSVKIVYSRWGTTGSQYGGRTLNGHYKIRLPLQKAFYRRAEYRKAQHIAYASAAMDHIKKNDAKRWADLKNELKPSWKTTNRLVARYIMTSKDNDRGTKAFIAWKTGMVIRTYKNSTTANQLGAGGERSTWERETRNVLVKLQMNGKNATMKDFNNRYERACMTRKKIENIYAKTSRFRVVKRSYLKRAIKRSNLRVKSVQEERKKIETVSRVFCIS